MSVCIALICDKGKTVVMTSDTKVDFGGYSAEVAQKNRPFGHYCSVMVAGDDVEYAAPILDRSMAIALKADLGEVPHPSVIADAIDEAYGEKMSGIIERRILRKHGFNAETFRQKGRQQCTSSQYLNLCNRIDQLKIKLEFLVCGLDSKKEAYLFVVNGADAPKDYSSVGMWAIGSGAYSAMSWLAFHADQNHFSRYSNLQDALYFALTAKFMAEADGQVGRRKTFTVTLEQDGVGHFVLNRSAEKVRAIWKRYGQPPVPKNLAGKMQPFIGRFSEHKSETPTQSVSQTSKDSQ